MSGRLTFISEHSYSDGEQSTQHVEQSDGGLQRPFILTLGALGALLDPCIKKKRKIQYIFLEVLEGHVGRIWC